MQSTGGVGNESSRALTLEAVPDRFLISTHYVKYDPKLFFINFAACVFVLFPKLPAVSRPDSHRQRSRALTRKFSRPSLSAPSTTIPFHPAREQVFAFERSHAEP